MKKLLIILICSFGLANGVIASSRFSLVYCAASIYCPTGRSSDCLIPPGWYNFVGTINKGETLLFSEARVIGTNRGECIYTSAINTDTLTMRSDTPTLTDANKIPGNRWMTGIEPICDAVLYPTLCPFSTV